MFDLDHVVAGLDDQQWYFLFLLFVSNEIYVDMKATLFPFNIRETSCVSS
jgi:hypothetical protein